jgi:hypothetical protein
VYYVSSIVVAALIWGGVSNLADLSWAIIIVATANVPLIWLGVAIIRLTRPMER